VWPSSMPPERSLKDGHTVRCWLHESVPQEDTRPIHGKDGAGAGVNAAGAEAAGDTP
jgi:hypothetical protein